MVLSEKLQIHPARPKELGRTGGGGVGLSDVGTIKKLTKHPI